MTTRGRTAALRVTPSYVLLLVASWAVLCIVADRATRDAVLQANSTDVANLLSGRIYSLATSAALVEGPGCLAVVAAAAGVLGFAERAWGPGRLVATFVLGHVGASVLVFAGLAAGLVAHAFRPGVATATDVGVSYGLLAVLGALLANRACPGPACGRAPPSPSCWAPPRSGTPSRTSVTWWRCCWGSPPAVHRHTAGAYAARPTCA